MKWLLGILFSALILIGLGLGLMGNKDDVAYSKNGEAFALYEEGTEALLAYCNSEATKKLEMALKLDPSMAEAKISLAAAQARLGLRDLAKTNLGQADSLTSLLKDDQRRLTAQLRLSDLGLQKYDCIRDSIITSLKNLQPNNLYLLISGANKAYAMNDRQKAEELYLKILDVDPNYAGSYNMLGYMELRAANFEKAIEYMQKYAFLAPSIANPHDSMGEVLMVMGRYEEAEKEFRKSISIQPDFYNSLISIAQINIARGQMKVGAKILQDLSDTVAGSSIEMRINKILISAYHTIGNNDLLTESTANYISKFPEDPSTCFYRSIRLAYRGESRQGQAVMDSCLAEWRGYPGFHTMDDLKMGAESMSRTFDALLAELDGEYATAFRMWSRVEEIQRTKFDINERWKPYYYMAKSQRLNGEPAEALTNVATVLEVNSRQIQTLIIAAECHLDLNQVQQARKMVDHLRKSLKWADQDYPHLADLKRLETAVAELEGNS